MNTGLIVFISVALGVSLFIAVFALASFWIRRLRRSAIAQLREELGTERVYQVDDCNFFGVSSSGYGQVRGNGMLALTEKGIHFRMLAPRKNFFIPLNSVREVSHPRSFLGKSKARTLLRVDFFNVQGEKDAAAWLVPHHEWWGRAIMDMRAGMEPPPHSA
jgi:hypothetical protein